MVDQRSAPQPIAKMSPDTPIRCEWPPHAVSHWFDARKFNRLPTRTDQAKYLATRRFEVLLAAQQNASMENIVRILADEFDISEKDIFGTENSPMLKLVRGAAIRLFRIFNQDIPRQYHSELYSFSGDIDEDFIIPRFPGDPKEDWMVFEQRAEEKLLNLRRYYRQQHHSFRENLISSEISEILKWFDELKSKLERETIETTSTDDSEIDPRLVQLDQFAEDNPGHPVSPLVVKLFPELKLVSPRQTQIAVEMPDTAPALWAVDREPGELPPSFIKRYYQPWLGRGLHSADIRRLDPHLYDAYYKHIERNPQNALDLPTRKPDNQSWVDRVMSGEPEALEEAKVMQRRLTALNRARAKSRQ